MKPTNHKHVYHITSNDNIDGIKKNGIKCGADNHIYLITELTVDTPAFNLKTFIPDILCMKQLFIKDYCLIQVDMNGITGKIYQDNVAESTAGFQLRLKQKVIKPEYLSGYENRVLDIDAANNYEWAKTLVMIYPELENFQPQDIKEMWLSFLVSAQK